jgi:hypothetical protein
MASIRATENRDSGLPHNHLSVPHRYALIGNPLIEILCYEPDPSATQSNEWNPSFLDKPADKTLRASQSSCGSTNV